MADGNRWKPPAEEEEDEEEIDEATYKADKDAVLFVIEVSPSMLTMPPSVDTKNQDRHTPTSAALDCAYRLMQQRIISNPSDMMGILLYGTEGTKFQEEEQARGGLAYPHCYLLMDLNVPDAADVKAVRSLVEDEEESKKLLVPSAERVTMANMLFCANQIFTTRAPNFNSRRLFVVTDDDDPHSKDKALRSSAAVRAKDLYDLGVIIELFPISRLDHAFDRSKFYDDIIYNTRPLDPEAPAPVSGTSSQTLTADGISFLSSLLSSINSKAIPRRTLFSSLPFEIGPGFKISVKGFVIFKRQQPKSSCYIDLSGSKAQIAIGTSTQVADDTARSVEKVEIKKAFKFGGSQVLFTLEEISQIRHFGDPGIRIVGFKPLSSLPIWANFKPATFIYPSEEDYIGSTRVFSALHQKLLQDQKIAITWFIARKNASPVIAALIPGAEKFDDSGLQIVPPGMWLAPLPFADDIRQNPETRLVPAPEPLIDKMRAVVQQLQLPKGVYDPRKYPNPALQWHYRILQAMALDEDVPEKQEDKTLPKYKQIDKRAGALVIDWGHELHRQYDEWRSSNEASIPTSSGKRVADDVVRSGKRAKTEEVEGIGDEEMRVAFEKETIVKMTMPQLKAWLQAKGMHVSGKKVDLIDRIEGHFEHK